MRYSDGVRQGLPYGGPLLAVRTELGPVVGGGGVVVNQSACGEDVHQGRGEALAGREAVDQRVGTDRAAAGPVDPARVGVDDRLAVQIGRRLEAALPAGVDEFGEHPADPCLRIRAHPVVHPGIMGTARSRGDGSEPCGGAAA